MKITVDVVPFPDRVVYDLTIHQDWKKITLRCTSEKHAADLQDALEQNVISVSVSPERSTNHAQS